MFESLAKLKWKLALVKSTDFSLAFDNIVPTTIRLFGVALIPDDTDPAIGHLASITEAGLMNLLEMYQNENVPYHVTYDIWSQLAASLHCIHAKKIIHLDLKPENVLIIQVRRYFKRPIV